LCHKRFFLNFLFRYFKRGEERRPQSFLVNPHSSKDKRLGLQVKLPQPKVESPHCSKEVSTIPGTDPKTLHVIRIHSSNSSQCPNNVQIQSTEKFYSNDILYLCRDKGLYISFSLHHTLPGSHCHTLSHPLRRLDYGLLDRHMWHYLKRKHKKADVYLQTPFIRIIRSKIFPQICIQSDAKQINVEVNICFRANICFTFSHTGKYLLQNISFEANIYTSEFHIQSNNCLQLFANKQISACKYSHSSKYSLFIASNYIGKKSMFH
jgi:hypothetical protein